MNDKTTKQQVRRDFAYARKLMRYADQCMKAKEPDLEEMQEIACELIACVGTFDQYVFEKMGGAA